MNGLVKELEILKENNKTIALISLYALLDKHDIKLTESKKKELIKKSKLIASSQNEQMKFESITMLEAISFIKDLDKKSKKSKKPK